MSSAPLYFAVIALLILFILLTGLRLSKLGKPYNIAIFTIHKLISLAVLVLVIILLFQIHKTVGINSNSLILAIATGLLLLAAIISGGLLSAIKTTPTGILRLHQIASGLTVISILALFYVLGSLL